MGVEAQAGAVVAVVDAAREYVGLLTLGDPTIAAEGTALAPLRLAIEALDGKQDGS